MLRANGVEIGDEDDLRLFYRNKIFHGQSIEPHNYVGASVKNCEFILQSTTCGWDYNVWVEWADVIERGPLINHILWLLR